MTDAEEGVVGATVRDLIDKQDFYSLMDDWEVCVGMNSSTPEAINAMIERMEDYRDGIANILDGLQKIKLT